jgi:hypothetical protein
MPSAWITPRATKDGGKRYRVFYRAVRSHSPRYAGSFATLREAGLRKSWVQGELAACRIPDLSILRESEKAPTLREAAEHWKASAWT